MKPGSRIVLVHLFHRFLTRHINRVCAGHYILDHVNGGVDVVDIVERLPARSCGQKLRHQLLLAQAEVFVGLLQLVLTVVKKLDLVAAAGQKVELLRGNLSRGKTEIMKCMGRLIRKATTSIMFELSTFTRFSVDGVTTLGSISIFFLKTD